MAELKTCGKDGCNPVEQVRGEMGPGDYFGQPEDYHTQVEMHDDIRNDFRICCKKCGKATGWNHKDLPNMPGAGADYVRKVWNGDA